MQRAGAGAGIELRLEHVDAQLRQGQRVNFDLDADGRATAVRTGAEVDMALPPDVQV